MSIQLGKLCAALLDHYFGTIIRTVGESLFASISKTISGIKQDTQLSTKEIIRALQVLLKFGLIKYKPSLFNETTPEFSLLPASILLLVRFPRYVHLMQTKFNHTAATLTGELLRQGCSTASIIIVKSAEDATPEKIQEYRQCFAEMVAANFFIRAPVPSTASNDKILAVPILESDPSKLFQMPELDVRSLIAFANGQTIQMEDTNIFWAINFDRFHQEFRESLIAGAIDKRFDSSAGECFRQMNTLMSQSTDPWKATLGPMSLAEINRYCEKKSLNTNAVKNTEQYVTIINNDSMGFLLKQDGNEGGFYTINVRRSILELTWNCIEEIVAQKFGAKAARIFRVVRLKKYIEQEDIQREAMIPAKEAKLLTYKLLEENFLHLHTVRKAGGGGSGPAKAFYLFHIKVSQIVTMLMDNCYKSIYNLLYRNIDIRGMNKRLIDKSQYIEGVVEDLKEKGDEEAVQQIADLLEQITPPERDILKKVKSKQKTLSTAELAIDETLFLFQMYQYYNSLP